MNNNTPNPNTATVRVHSKLVDGGNLKNTEHGTVGHSAITLWYYVKSLDKTGSGWAEFTLQDAASHLGRSVPTVKRYLRQGLKLSLFRRVDKQGNVVRVFYTSLFKVCKAFGISNWGAVTEVSINDLDISLLKLIATQAETQRLQECSRRQAIRLHKKGVAESSNLVSSSQSSRGARGTILHRGSRTLFVDEDFIPFGVSQRGVADSLNRSDRTIRKRLSNSYRNDRGLVALERVQIAQTTEQLNDRFGWLFNQFERSELKQFSGIWKTDLSDRVFKCGGRVFKSLCNVYAKDLVLNSMRRSRSVFKRFWNTVSLGDSLRVEEIRDQEEDLINNNLGKWLVPE